MFNFNEKDLIGLKPRKNHSTIVTGVPTGNITKQGFVSRESVLRIMKDQP